MQWKKAKALVGAEETPRHKQKSEEGGAMTMNLVAQVHEHKHRVSGLTKSKQSQGERESNRREVEERTTHQLASVKRDRDPVRTISFGNQIEQKQGVRSELVRWEERDSREKGVGVRED